MVEPGWLGQVHAGQWDATDREMVRICHKARGKDHEFVVRQVHGLDLVYRQPREGIFQLVIPKSRGLR